MKLNDKAFTTLSPNGEKVERNWLMYSPSTGCVMREFRIETFYAILDRIVTDLNNRIRAYSETDTRFLFLRHYELENFDAVKRFLVSINIVLFR